MLLHQISIFVLKLITGLNGFAEKFAQDETMTNLAKNHHCDNSILCSLDHIQ